ncbi:putative protein OS-9 like protein [Glarea lozoyensis 74030]|uniref:2EXR domain-containing protein n=1 Tax=Glarea lozoyensis (strain ATCC 74030 / MF5533) TaxID=1104152 RepID=H0EWK8_GLAL7|nr:putative protein OS-9 like protein [Glarea lozoyensis 74030]
MAIPANFNSDSFGKHIEIIGKARSKAEGGQVEMFSDAELQELDLDPDMVEQVRKQVEQLAKEKGWKIEVVDSPALQPPNTFPFFQKLPTELRLMIWNLVPTPRQQTLTWTPTQRGLGDLAPMPPPPLLSGAGTGILRGWRAVDVFRMSGGRKTSSWWWLGENGGGHLC